MANNPHSHKAPSRANVEILKLVLRAFDGTGVSFVHVLMLVFLVWGGLSCSRPAGRSFSGIKARVMTEANQKALLEEVDASNLTPEERRCLMTYIALVESSRVVPPPAGIFEGKKPEWKNKRIGEMIAEGRQFLEYADRLDAKRKVESTVLREIVDLKLTEIQGGQSWSGRFPCKFEYTNRGSKVIRAFRGEVSFKNVYGDHLGAIIIEVTEPVAVKAEGHLEMDAEFEGSSAKILSRDPNQHNIINSVRYEWKPRTVVFDDGTTLSVPD
jgi:hypothetical protein